MRKGPTDESGAAGDLAPELLAELRAAAALPDERINVEDVPEAADWSGAVRGRFYRPVKRQVTLRLDADVLAFFRATEPHYQTAINRVLRAAMLRGLRRRRAAVARTGGSTA
jgi:uncharacterized protein (DUF4415 family)